MSDATATPDEDAKRDGEAPGQRTHKPARLLMANGWDVAKRTWKEAGADNLEMIAAGVAFYAFLALVPLLTAVVLSYGLVSNPATVAADIARLSTAMPEQAAQIIGDQLENMVETADSAIGFALLLTLGIAFYGAMRGAGAIIVALNVVFDVGEQRGYLRRTGVAMAITLGLVLAFLFASLAISALGLLRSLVPDLGGIVHNLLQAGFWLSAALVVSFVVALIYRYAPNRPRAHWRWITPGSALATLVWIAATFVFGFYVSRFGNYNATYGSLGAVIVFLTWLYLSAYILLLGAELNSVLERRVEDQGLDS
jgi:membrane protein